VKRGSSHDVGMQLSFAVYGAANRVARLHKSLLEPLGLTFPKYLVMLELFRQSPQSVGELGLALDMDTGTITPLLKRMEAAGMVTRTRDPSDERRVMVEPTPEGEAKREAVWGIGGKIESACQLDEKGLVALRDTLRNLGHPRNG
jgi:DNA-binding MarR family transcriptional regulator